MQIIIRPVHARMEINEIDAFYRAHSKQHLPQPETESICRAAEDGRLFAADLEVSGQPRRMVALAGLFPVATGGDPRAPVPILELAGMALDGAAVGGLEPHTLQDVPVWTRICGVLAECAGSRICVLSSVVDENEKSLASMARCGLIPVKTPEWLKSIHRGWLSGDHGRIVDLILKPEAICSQARNFREFLKSGVLNRKNKATGRHETFLVRFDLGWARRGHPVIKAVARGESVPWLAEVPPRRIILLGDDEDGDWVFHDGPPASRD